MSSKAQKIKHLGDHLPYEMLMLRHAYARTLCDRYALDWNAFYEAFAVHARNLFDILTNKRPRKGEGNNFKGSDFSRTFKAKKNMQVEKIINQDLHWQVLHFGKARKSEQEHKVGKEQRKKVFDWIEENFGRFIAELDDELKPHWYPERADPEKVRKELLKGTATWIPGRLLSSQQGTSSAPSWLPK